MGQTFFFIWGYPRKIREGRGGHFEKATNSSELRPFDTLFGFYMAHLFWWLKVSREKNKTCLDKVVALDLSFHLVGVTFL